MSPTGTHNQRTRYEAQMYSRKNLTFIESSGGARCV